MENEEGTYNVIETKDEEDSVFGDGKKKTKETRSVSSWNLFVAEYLSEMHKRRQYGKESLDFGETSRLLKYRWKKMSEENKKIYRQKAHLATTTLYKCSCGKSYRKKHEMNRHVKDCNGQRYFCEEEGCDKSYPSKLALQLHTRVNHQGKAQKRRPSTCEICSKVFACAANMRKHVKTIHQGV